MDSLLTVRDLQIQFQTKKGINTAVDGIGFSVGKGEILGIIGAVIGTVLIGPEGGFLILIAIALVFALLLALLGSILFGRMESLENY